MRLFSSKKICIMIASAGLLFAGVLIGTSVFRQHEARRTFEEEGYILTMAEDEDQVIVNQENRFASGSVWSRAGISSVAFRDEEGDRVVVDSDSFIHYDSNSLAAVKDGAISDMDQYLDGVIGCCYLPAGNTLVWDGSGFTAQSSDGEKRFENFIWKNSEQRYLLGSSSFTIRFSGGKQEVSDSGFLELYYLGNDKKIMQLTSGDNAWQVVTKDSTITFANGVILNCEDGSISRSAQEASDSTDTASADNMAQPTMSLQSIEIDATGSIMLGSTQYSSVQPTFRFTLFDGQDGASGENGAEGAPGEAGEDGEDGERGTEGVAGQEGQAGATGSTGTAGGAYTTVINGGVDTGIEIKTGIPAVIAPDEEWKITKAERSFQLVYEQEAYELVEVEQDKAYVYLYNVKTGEILQEWNNCTIGSEQTPGDPVAFQLDNDVTLEMDTTYGVAAIDTYTLGGTKYTTKLFEKIFTTDSSGVQVQLQDRTSDSFSLGVTSDSYTSIEKVSVKFYDQNGALTKEEDGTQTELDPEVYEAPTDFSRFKIGVSSGLKSNTWYRMKVSVACKVGSTSTTIEKELDWTTLKQEPTLGGLELRTENGYLVAKVRGKWNGTAYVDPTDPDRALESITYRLYDASGLLAANGIAKQEETSASTADVYFKVDGSIINNQSVYYVVADYTWNDGARSITVPVKESGVPKESTSNPGITTSALNGRAFAESQALVNNGVSISFSGNGTKLYNLTSGDASEGTTYESIRGSLLVNLNGIRINVNDTRAMQLKVTDNKTYDKTLKFTSCDGKQGDMEGSFALPLDVDGLLANSTYAFTLSAYVYDQSKDSYKYQTIGTLTIRTDAEADITMGMRQASNGGTGVDFWLGSKEYTDAIGLKNYYNQEHKTYVLENGSEDGESDYFAKTNASYRNLSSIVFELYAGASQNPDPSDLLGTCTVYGTDSNGDRATFMPGYSILYQKYYGSAVANCKDNNVGVGESFAHQFEYSENTHRTGKIAEDELSKLSGGKFTIKVRVCYDYTYDRYNYSGNDNLYDYFIESSYLNMEDYVNELTVNNGTGLISDMVYQDRPVAPSSLVDKNGYAVTVESLLNENEGKSNGDDGQNKKYDAALLDDTVVGVEVKTSYKDSSRMAKTVTFYGTTYDQFDQKWPSAKSLTEVRDDANLFGFKFTLPMTKDGTDTDLETEENRRVDIPHLKLYMYDSRDTDLTQYLTAHGFTERATDDRGYAYRKYDSTNDVWLVYTDNTFLRRGQTYIFAYDAELEFTINNNNGEFSYPGDYYENEWVSGKKYAKNTALLSPYTPLLKQEPQVDMELLSSKASKDVANTGSTETWQIYLDDPDDAVKADSLLGYNKEYEYVGCIYDAYGNPLTDQQSNNYASSILMTFKPDGSEHKIQYAMLKDDLNKDRIMASLDNYSVPTTGATDEQKQTMKALLDAMKKVTVDSAGTVQAGTQITVKRLDPNGVFYSWQAVYRLLDDYQSKNEQGRIPLTEHFYAGHETWEADSQTAESFQLQTKNQNGSTDGNYTVTTTVDKDTDDIISVDIARPEGTSNYYADMKRIAAVQITAEKQGAGETSWTQINAKDKDGNNTTEPYLVWKAVNELSGSNYGFTFRISEFNQSSKGGDSPFNAGDKLKFTYTFYYENGERSTPQEIADANTTTDSVWYALKSMNGKQNGTALYERASRKDKVETIQLNQQNSANSSIYKIAAEDGTDKVKPQISRTAVQGNDGNRYVTDMKQTYTLTQNPVVGSDLPEKGTLTRTESLRYGVDDETGYRGVNVTEFCKLGSMEATAEVSIGSIAPTLSSHSITRGITQAKMDLSIESYNLMPYPEGEKLHLYYALYKVTEEESMPGEKPTEKLDLAGVMIGEEKQTDEETGELLRSRSILLDKLEKNQKYRLYVYYKDNRDSKAKTDAQIFGSALSGVTPGQFITDPTKAKALAACFTKVEGSNLVPSDNNPKNHIRKIMGYREVVVKAAGTDGSGNPTPAVLDYYDEFTTLEGIEIKKITANLGQLNSYLVGVNNPDPTGAEGEHSGKTLRVTAITSARQNDYTRMFFVLERCPLDKRWTDENNWKTVVADMGTTGVSESNEDYAPEYPTDKSINPEFRDWDGNVTKLTKNNFRSYGESYIYNPLTASGSEYTASMELTYYPGQVILPGYYYRVRAMIFQYEEGWTDPTLVSLAEVKSDQQYLSSGVWIWQKYEYNASDLPIKVTNVERDQKTIKATVRATDTGFYLDNYYYARLWKYDTGTNNWVLLEEDQYYGTTSATSSTTWNKKALKVGDTYVLSFKELTPNTQYQIRFYGLMDSDYNNKLNIAGTGGPLTAEDNTLIYTNTENYQSDPQNTKLNNSLSALYRKYLGIASSAKAAELKIANATNAEQVLLNTSSNITTFAADQTATIGSMYQYIVNASAHQIQLFFDGASGLSNAKTISYTISYLGAATDVGTVSGQITAGNKDKSPMDNGGTNGDVALTIKDDRLDLSNSGTYYIQLRVLDKDGKTIEEPATIDIDVD